MKKKSQLEDDKELEILKAVAQAWYSHSGSSGTTSEFDAHRRNFPGRLPSRFKLEAMRKPSTRNANWDFGQSLWDAYEIVAVSKRLERGLVIDDNPVSNVDGPATQVHKRRRESKHSLGSMFGKMSSRRFTEAVIPPDEDA